MITISDFIKWLIKRVYSERSILLLARSPETLNEFEKVNNAVEFFAPLEDDIKRFYRKDADRQKEYIRAIASGEQAVFATIAGELCYRMWIQRTGMVMFDGCPIFQLGEGEIYCKNIFVNPQARGKGIQRLGFDYAIEKYKKAVMYIMVLPTNTVSLNNCIKKGFKPIKTITVKNRLFYRRAIVDALDMEEK